MTRQLNPTAQNEIFLTRATESKIEELIENSQIEFKAVYKGQEYTVTVEKDETTDISQAYIGVDLAFADEFDMIFYTDSDATHNKGDIYMRMLDTSSEGSVDFELVDFLV